MHDDSHSSSQPLRLRSGTWRAFASLAMVFGLIWSSLAANGQEEPAAPIRSPRVSVRGVVVDDRDRPIAGATVSIGDRWQSRKESMEYSPYAPIAEVQTDARGEFEIVDAQSQYSETGILSRGEWDLFVTAAGYGVTGGMIADDQVGKSIRIQMSNAAQVTGQVVDEQGQPLEGAEVTVSGIARLGWQIHRAPEDYLRMRPSVTPPVKTDANGLFELEGLPADRLIMLGFVEGTRIREGAYVATTVDPQPEIKFGRIAGYDGGQVQWEPLPVHTAPFTVTLRPGFSVSGRVIREQDGKGVADKAISFGYFNQSSSKLTDAEGRFAFVGVPTKTNRLSVAGGVDHLGCRIAVEFSQERMDLQIEVPLPEGIAVQGRVIDQQTGRGISGAILYDRAMEAVPYESLETSYFSDPGKTDADGGFQMRIPAGKRRLSVVGPVTGYDLPSLSDLYKPGATTEFEVSLDLEPGNSPPPITFRVPPGRVIAGLVVDPEDNSVEGAEIYVARYWQDSLRHVAVSDRNGKFIVPAGPRGTTPTILAFHRQRKLKGRVEAADSNPADEKLDQDPPVTLRLQKVGRIVGRVTDGSEPVPEINLIVWESFADEQGQQWGMANIKGVTGADGTFALELLEPARKYMVRIDPSEYEGHVSLEVEVTANGEHTIPPIVIRPLDESVAGVVVNSDGIPLADVDVVVVERNSNAPLRTGVLVTQTDKDGRFVIRRLPNTRLKVLAHVNPGPLKRVEFSGFVNAEPGDTDLRIVVKRHAP
ncbi:MAG: hypothetical protein ACKV0T_02195 [Planctomycetales bacterium]